MESLATDSQLLEGLVVYFRVKAAFEFAQSWRCRFERPWNAQR